MDSVKSKHSNAIYYSQCWEDTEVLLQALEVGNTETILSITSGGDNSLALLGRLPSVIHCIDSHKSQNFLLELKYQAIKELDYPSLIQFLGYRECGHRVVMYSAIKESLRNECRYYWDTHQYIIQKGIIHSGRLEKYLNGFRKYILPLIHSKAEVQELFRLKTPQEQESFYQNSWNNRRWRMLFRIFFSESLMKMLGRQKSMFSYSCTKNLGEYFLEKTKNALIKPSLFNNSYLDYILDSKYPGDLPVYLHEETIKQIKNHSSDMQIYQGDLLDHLLNTPANYYSRFNLSDVFESMSEAKTEVLFEHILRCGKNKARIIFWNNLVPRDVPPRLSKYFIFKEDLHQQLSQKERVFFYSALKIYTLKK